MTPSNEQTNIQKNESNCDYNQWFMVDGDLDDFIFFNDDQQQPSQR
ncbi:MAG: hypothetical protein RR497_01570 [Oscillospiraceae bacterium]